MPRWIAIAGFLIFASLNCGWAPEAASAQSNAPDAVPPPAAARKAAKKPAPQATPSDVIPDAPAPSGDAGAPVQGSPPQTGDALSDDPGRHQAAPAAQTPPTAPPTTPAKKHTAAEENPFPEEDSKQAAHDAAGDAGGAVDRLTDSSPAGSPPSGSGSGSRAPGSGSTPDSSPKSTGDAAGSSSRQGLDKLDLYGEKEKKSAGHRRNGDPDAGLAYDPKLAAEDDKIADLYMKHGNAPGAYSRYKDAEAHDGGDATAVFGVAESARQMNLIDEAAQAYQTYLFAFPDGPKARVAKKALAELKVQARH